MAFTEFFNTVLAELIFLTPSGKAENTLWFTKPTAWSIGDAEAFAAALHTWFNDYGKFTLPDTIQLDLITITDMHTQFGFKVEYPVSPAVAGTIAGGQVPMNGTVTCSFKTAIRGRSFRGRNYVIALPRSAVVNDQITIAHADLITEAYNNLVPSVEGEVPFEVEHVVAGRRPLGTTPETYDGVVTPIISYIVERTVDSQRRRLLGRGE